MDYLTLFPHCWVMSQSYAVFLVFASFSGDFFQKKWPSQVGGV